MKQILTMLLACALATTAAAQRSADSTNDQRALLALEDHWLAFEDNPDSLAPILASDFIHALPFGFITRDDQLGFMRRLQNHPPPPPGVKHFEERRVRVYGDVGIVNGIVVEDTTGGQRRTVFTDVFVRRDGRWQAVNAQELPFQKR